MQSGGWRSAFLAAAVAFGVLCPRLELAAQPAETKAEPKEAAGKGRRAQEFIAAFNRGDAKAVVGFWTPEATYVDQDGREFKGRAALQKLYESVFAENKGAKLSINVLSARLITPDVALEEGISEVTPAAGGPPSVARFSAVLVKKDGQWYFESVHEALARPPSHVEQFAGIEWLIGDWASEPEKGESMAASYGWAENQNFIVSHFSTRLNGLPVVGGTQWIGWDAIDKQIRSWSFYSGGGFGEATWLPEGDSKWSIKVRARTAGGQKIEATNVLTKVDVDHATWQMTKITLDGQPMPDGAVTKLTRVKPAR
jgi:uncharacterized protein (TIGR02246 family)